MWVGVGSLLGSKVVTCLDYGLLLSTVAMHKSHEQQQLPTAGATLSEEPFDLHPALIRVLGRHDYARLQASPTIASRGHNAPHVQQRTGLIESTKEGLHFHRQNETAVMTCCSTCNAVLMPHCSGLSCACLALQERPYSALYSALLSLS